MENITEPKSNLAAKVNTGVLEQQENPAWLFAANCYVVFTHK